MTTDPSRLYDRDLLLDGVTGAVDVGADLAPGPAGDLRLADGDQTVTQALAMRLRVRRGELAALGEPAYGSRLHELIGEPNNDRTRLLLAGYARAAIEEDPRVAQVRSATATAIPGERDTVRLSLDVLLIDQPTPLTLAHDVSLGN